jgi:mannose-1-phosphate guanylyltransferase
MKQAPLRQAFALQQPFVALIMAGGVGQRFWPLSTADRPKQFLDLERTGRTLLQATFDRVLPAATRADNIFIITGEHYAKLVQEQLPELPKDNILLEPIGRDTAPAIALAMLEIKHRRGNVVVGVFPSDHRVGNLPAFLDVTTVAIEQAQRTKGLITLGIEPNHPATGYGYIERGEAAGRSYREGQYQDCLFQVTRFVEKPPLELAKAYLASGKFSWNGGIFFWQIETVLRELAIYAPLLLNTLTEARQTGSVKEVFPALPKISIDYAVLEKTKNAFVIPAEFEWDDLGDWQALERLLQKEQGDINTVVGRHVGLEASGNIIYSEDENDMIVTLGIEDLIIVKRQNAMLLARKDKIQDIKRLLNDERLTHFVLR